MLRELLYESVIVLILNTPGFDSLSCFDGADCIATASCGECNGVACIRFRSFNTEHNHEIALTCLPYATRSFQLEPAGCHISGTGDGEVCICYDKDYCNRGASHHMHISSIHFYDFVCAERQQLVEGLESCSRFSEDLANTCASMYALDDITRLAIPRGSVLSELTFIYRYSFLIKEGTSIWNFCCGRFRTAYGTRAVNWSVQTDGSLIEVRSFDTLDKLPEGKYRLLLNATSRDGTQEAASCITFLDRSCDIEGTAFQKTMARLTSEKSNFIGGEACINVELTFPAEEFVDPKPNYVLPEIPNHLAANDYRIVMVEKASEISDFTIETLSGFIRTVRLLLILSTRYFRDFIALNPSASTATLPFSKDTVNEVLKFAFTGSFDLAEADVDVLDEFLSCIELVLPTDTRSLTERIALTLRRRVNKEWQILTLHEVLKLLVLSCKHALWDLTCTMTNLVANVHYKVFLRDYNAHSTGQNLQLYRQLREQTFRFVHPLENMRRKYEQSTKMRPILRFSSNDNADENIS